MRPRSAAMAISRPAAARSGVMGFSTSTSMPEPSRKAAMSSWAVVGAATMAASTWPASARKSVRALVWYLAAASAARDFDQRQRPPVHQSGGAAQHGVGAFHGFESHAGALADDHALSHVESGQGVGDAAAVFDIGGLVFGGLAPGHWPGGGKQRF